MIKIEEKLVKFNYSSRKGTKIQYIVIHDTGNTSRGADANAHFNYFNSGNKGASAHYFVDDKQILRIIKDEEKSWNCGDGKGKYNITNENSIGVEICINEDGDFNKALENTIQLTKYLMTKYNIPLEKVVRHYDASRKICPKSMYNNNWLLWQEFKNNLIEKKQLYKNTISKLYKDILKRDADEEGLNYWSNKIQTLEELGAFVLDLYKSKEYININP